MTSRGELGRLSLTFLLLLAVAISGVPSASGHRINVPAVSMGATTTNPAVSNFTSAIDRLVTLAAAAGAGLLSLVWARVALSWFSHDSMKKVLAKERARDALIGTLLFVGAVSGLIWALANWVVTGI
ncbi:MAG: hypothetical protein WA688_09405 [Thermoplasmata archaeon]